MNLGALESIAYTGHANLFFRVSISTISNATHTQIDALIASSTRAGAAQEVKMDIVQDAEQPPGIAIAVVVQRVEGASYAAYR